jgi:uncharacterized membrane protein
MFEAIIVMAIVAMLTVTIGFPMTMLVVVMAFLWSIVANMIDPEGKM